MQGAAKKSARHVNESDLSVICNAAMIVVGETILWVGEKKHLSRELKKVRQAEQTKRASQTQQMHEEINLKAECVMPAFLECHTHLIFAGDRKHEFELRNQGATYQQIAAQGGGIRYTVQETQKASATELLKLAEKRAQYFLKQGVTVVEVKSGYGLTHKDEIKILEVAKKIKSVDVVSTYLGAHAIPKDQDVADYLNEMVEKTLPYLKQKKLAERVDMFIERNYYSLEHAKKYYLAATQLGFRLTAHAEQLNRLGGAQYLSGLENTDSVDHLVQVDKSDIARLAKSSATSVLLPASDFYLRMKYPPARELIDAGACVALATDFNPGTSPTQSVNFVGVLARLEMKMQLHEVLAAYTIGAAHALNRHQQLGSLEVGKRADFSVLEGSYADLFYQVGDHPVHSVFRKGERVV